MIAMTVESAQQLLAQLTAAVSGGDLVAASTALRSLKLCFTALPALQPLAASSGSAAAERALAMRTYEQAVMLSLAQKDQRSLQVCLLGRRRPARLGRDCCAAALTLPASLIFAALPLPGSAT